MSTLFSSVCFVWVQRGKVRALREDMAREGTLFFVRQDVVFISHEPFFGWWLNERAQRR